MVQTKTVGSTISCLWPGHRTTLDCLRICPTNPMPTYTATVPGDALTLLSMSAEDCTAHQNPRLPLRFLPFPATVEP